MLRYFLQLEFQRRLGIFYVMSFLNDVTRNMVLILVCGNVPLHSYATMRCGELTFVQDEREISATLLTVVGDG